MNFGTVNLAYNNLIRAIVSRDSINVGRIIQNSIVKSMNSTQLGFYHPPLIIEICRAAGVRIIKNEEMLPPLHIENNVEFKCGGG